MGLCMWVTEMSDDLRTRIAAVAQNHVRCDDCTFAKTPQQRYLHFADAVIDEITPAINAQLTDTNLLAIGSCIAFIDATTAAALAAESEHNARVIAEWAGKVTTAMRRASAEITPGGRQ